MRRLHILAKGLQDRSVKVIEAQFLIAVVNCILTVIALIVLGFPQLLVLAVMIFYLD